MSVLEAENAVFTRLCCLYIPLDKGEEVWPWYEKYFNGVTRHHNLYMDEVEKKEELTNTFLTDEWIPGETYEMFSVRFETDCIEELYKRLSDAGVELEPLQKVDNKGHMFCYKDPQGHKYQVWQDPRTETQPIREGVPVFIRVAAIFFPASDPAASYKWCIETLGLSVNESGQPVTEAGEEIYFIRTLQPGKTYNFFGPGDIRNMAFALFATKGITKLRMRDEGLKVNYHIQDRGGCGHQFQICDPDGNKWDIWELQTMVHWREEGVDSANWKDRYLFCDCYGERSIDDFFQMLKDRGTGEPIGTVQIVEYNKMLKNDPEGVQKLIETLDQFCDQNPDLSFEILLREGWYDTIQSYVHREYNG